MPYGFIICKIFGPHTHVKANRKLLQYFSQAAEKAALTVF